MRTYKEWLLAIAVALALLVAWVQDITLSQRIDVHTMNVYINEVEQHIQHSRGNLLDQLDRISRRAGVQIKLIGNQDSLTIETPTSRGLTPVSIAASELRGGLYTYRGVDFYVVTLSTGERLAFYGTAPTIHQLHHSGISFSTWFLTLVLLVFVVVFILQRKRHKNFRDRLMILLGPEERPYLEQANFQKTYRYVLNKFSEYGQEIVDQQYKHNLENTKQDERMRNMMHDMKTPIAALHAFVEAFDDGLYTPEALPKKLPLVARNVNHLIRLMDQYDDYVKYATWTSKAQMRRYPIEVLFQDVVVGIERDFTMIGRTVQLVLMESPAYVVCDLTEIKKLLHILVENAHKYSELDKPIILSAMVRTGMLYITVKDYGIGIAPDQHQVIFDPFVKVDRARGASAQSYGIGLYIAKQIALRHGGDVTVDSALDRGSSFTLVLSVLSDQ